MAIHERLTYLQKVALKGEIAFALSTSSHSSEIKYRVYLMLREVEDKYKSFIIECVKEAITFNETEIDRIYLEIVNNTVPVWLWIEEVISDIKLSLTVADYGLVGVPLLKLGINKTVERKNLVESSFINFARQALSVSPYAAEQLFDEVLNDSELEFLHNACFYLKNYCPELIKVKGDEVPEDLMSCTFNIKKMLSFIAETKTLSTLNKMDKKVRRYQKLTGQPVPTQEPSTETFWDDNFMVSDSMTREQFTQHISEKIAELFDGRNSKAEVKPLPEKATYVVKKTYCDSGISVNIRICYSKEEAIDFIEKVTQEYPELTRTCKFTWERINENEQWQEKS